MVDTSNFDDAFRLQLLGAIPDLDEETDGLLIKSENFQALSSAAGDGSGRQVQCVYIDPPYNTGDDGFAYKDQYRHSSWAAMLLDRFEAARPMFALPGVAFVSIDDNEFRHLWYVFGEALALRTI